MAKASSVPIRGTDIEIMVQGFKRSGELEPYVFIGVMPNERHPFLFEGDLTPENAHILSEEIRKQAEFANDSAEEEN